MDSKKTRRHFVLVHLLPFLHFGACVIIAVAHLDSGWEYLGLIDVPASILIVALIYNFDHPLFLFGVIGTLWWYLLSRGAEIIIVSVSEAIQNLRG